jgi:hypothetical protein
VQEHFTMPPIPEEKLTEALPPNAPVEAMKSTSDEVADVDEDMDVSCRIKCWLKLIQFYREQEFIILIVLAILLAYAYPPLGATYLVPQITATWIAVIFIFLLAGLSLKTNEFKEAFQRFILTRSCNVTTSALYQHSCLASPDFL